MLKRRLRKSRAQERNAKATYERTRALYENQNASRQDLDADRTAYESGRAGLEAAHQQIRLRQRQLGYTHLKAPETGTLATVDIEVNEYVQAGELVATLLAGDQIEVSVSVPASIIRSIKKGAEALARFDSLGGKDACGNGHRSRRVERSWRHDVPGHRAVDRRVKTRCEPAWQPT